MFNIHRFTVVVLSVIVLVFLIGCDDDNNPVDDHNESEHLHAVGVKLVQENLDIIVAETADSADVVGLIELGEGTEQHFQVWFLNDENEWYYPGDQAGNYPDHELDVVIGHGDILDAEIEDWEIHLSGLHEGDSWIRVKVLHEGHSDYISPHLRAAVHYEEGTHGAPVGMYLKQAEEVIVTANASNEVLGQLLISESGSESFSVWFFDEYGVEFQPDDDHYLSTIIQDDQVVTSSIMSWDIELNGLSAGNTGITISLNHGDHSHYSSPEITVVVE